MSQVSLSHSHMMGKSHGRHGKIVQRLCSSYISSVQEIEKDSIEFPLSTQTWRVIKLSWLSCYRRRRVVIETEKKKRNVYHISEYYKPHKLGYEYHPSSVMM